MTAEIIATEIYVQQSGDDSYPWQRKNRNKDNNFIFKLYWRDSVYLYCVSSSNSSA